MAPNWLQAFTKISTTLVNKGFQLIYLFLRETERKILKFYHICYIKPLKNPISTRFLIKPPLFVLHWLKEIYSIKAETYDADYNIFTLYIAKIHFLKINAKNEILNSTVPRHGGINTCTIKIYSFTHI